MQFCPLCSKEYNNITKVCPLDHCNNCGSLDLKKQKSRRPNKGFGDSMIGAGVGLGFLIIFGTLIANAASLLYTSIPISMAIGLGILAYFRASTQNFSCVSCRSNKFTPIANIKVKKTKKLDTENGIQEDIEYQDKDGIIKKIDSLSESQTKHHKRDIILKIIGISVTAIIGVAGLVFNQEGIFSFFTDLMSK